MSLPESTQYAGFWRRFAATVIDTVILTPVLMVLLYMVFGKEYFSVMATDPDRFNGDIRYILINHVLPVILVVIFWVRFMGTPGKLLLGCHVVNASNGQRLGVGRALVRNLAYLVSMLPLFLGFVWIGIDRRKQGWHDKIAGTAVILHDESARSLDELMEEAE